MKYQIKTREEVAEELAPWIAGFVKKEYGTHVDPSDQQDLVQEGLMSLIGIVDKLRARPPRFGAKDEFIFYVKAVVRNAIRDYIIKFRSRFEISLYKYRQHKRETGQELGEFMSDVGDEFAYLQDEHADDPGEWQTKQRRLSLLSMVEKNGRGMEVHTQQQLLAQVLQEYREFLEKEGEWKDAMPASLEPVIDLSFPTAPSLALVPQRAPVNASVEPHIARCQNRFCGTDLNTVKTPIIIRGYGYCSKSCKKLWPASLIKLQTQYAAPIEVILTIALKLFRSKRRTAEILNMTTLTVDRLLKHFNIDE